MEARQDVTKSRSTPEEDGDVTLCIQQAYLGKYQFWLSGPQSVQILQYDTRGDCGEEELRSVLLKLIIYTESFCVQQPRPECPQREKSILWQAGYTGMCLYVVCVCTSTPSWASSVFTALDIAPWTFFPSVGILEF